MNSCILGVDEFQKIIKLRDIRSLRTSNIAGELMLREFNAFFVEAVLIDVFSGIGACTVLKLKCFSENHDAFKSVPGRTAGPGQRSQSMISPSTEVRQHFRDFC
jgi:hypothetical protein